MSLEKARAAIQAAKLPDNDRKWFPSWLARYAAVMQVEPQGLVPVDRDRVIQFLRTIKSLGKPAWQRLQAARAIEFYCQQVLRRVEPWFGEITSLLEHAAHAERAKPSTPLTHIAVEFATPIDPTEPLVVQELRREVRRRHYSRRTEKAYAGWAGRFLAYCHLGGETRLEGVGENEIKEFLSDLAVRGNVAASTQNQAFNALLFLFRDVLKRDLEFVDAVRAKRPQRLPVVLSRDEVQRLLAQLGGRDLLIAQILYGAGLRMLECLRLRVKDVDFDTRQLLVRDGKGQKDRATVLPGGVMDGLRRQIDARRQLHEQDIAAGNGRVWLPFALAAKYPNADRELAWQYVFPASRLVRNPANDIVLRHHLHESVFAPAMKSALRRAEIHKKATAHSLRKVYSYYDISWRTGYLKGKRACLLSSRGSWRPVLTAAISA